jgi:hypothetical protein
MGMAKRTLCTLGGAALKWRQDCDVLLLTVTGSNIAQEDKAGLTRNIRRQETEVQARMMSEIKVIPPERDKPPSD